MILKCIWQTEERYDILGEFLSGIEEYGNCPWILVGSCSTDLWIMQRSIRKVGWFSFSATVWKSERRLEIKESSGQVSGSFQISWPFFVRGNSLPDKSVFCMEI